MGTYTNDIADLDIFHLGSNTNSNANDLMADDLGIVCLTLSMERWLAGGNLGEGRQSGKCAHPSAGERVQIAGADTAILDLDVDVGLVPLLGLVLEPAEVPNGVLIKSAPALWKKGRQGSSGQSDAWDRLAFEGGGRETHRTCNQ